MTWARNLWFTSFFCICGTAHPNVLRTTAPDSLAISASIRQEAFAAMTRARRFLLDRQQPNGSWGASDTELTGLVLAALSPPTSHVEWMAMQKADSFLRAHVSPRRNSPTSCQHLGIKQDIDSSRPREERLRTLLAMQKMDAQGRGFWGVIDDDPDVVTSTAQALIQIRRLIEPPSSSSESITHSTL